MRLETAGGPSGSPDFMRSEANDPVRRVLIVGASARAAAHSCLRAGWSPTAIDLFGDDDLKATCPSRVIPFADYPRGSIELANATEPLEWFYTGALENHPEVVTSISKRHRLIGNDATVLAGARDPFLIGDILRRARLPGLRTVRAGGRSPGGRDWLMKPLRSAGGAGIRRIDKKREPEPGSDYYFQEYMEGIPCSAAFRVDSGRVSLLGVTRQLIGDANHPFRWRGNIRAVADTWDDGIRSHRDRRDPGSRARPRLALWD